jgi:hypothetical protein
VLVDGARMPTAAELPASLPGPARRQGLVVSRVADGDRLVRAIAESGDHHGLIARAARTELAGSYAIGSNSQPGAARSYRGTGEITATPEAYRLGVGLRPVEV